MTHITAADVDFEKRVRYIEDRIEFDLRKCEKASMKKIKHARNSQLATIMLWELLMKQAKRSAEEIYSLHGPDPLKRSSGMLPDERYQMTFTRRFLPEAVVEVLEYWLDVDHRFTIDIFAGKQLQKHVKKMDALRKNQFKQYCHFDSYCDWINNG